MQTHTKIGTRGSRTQRMGRHSLCLSVSLFLPPPPPHTHTHMHMRTPTPVHTKTRMHVAFKSRLGSVNISTHICKDMLRDKVIHGQGYKYAEMPIYSETCKHNRDVLQKHVRAHTYTRLYLSGRTQLGSVFLSLTKQQTGSC